MKNSFLITKGTRGSVFREPLIFDTPPGDPIHRLRLTQPRSHCVENLGPNSLGATH